MNRDDIIRMAREAGISKPWDQEPVKWETLEHFANLVAAAEREACAKVCDAYAPVGLNTVLTTVSDAIRGRGLQELNKAAEANGEEL